MNYKILILPIMLILLFVNISASSVAHYNFDVSTGNNYSLPLPITIMNPSVILEISTTLPVTCKYSVFQGLDYDYMEGIFDSNFETIHKKTLTDLVDGLYKYYVKCKNSSGYKSGELEAKFNVNIPITGRIVLSDGSLIKAGRQDVTLVTSKIVSQTPSLSYSLDGISYDPIPLVGSGTNWQGYLVIPDYLGEKAGSFKFQAKDLEGITGTEITSGGIFLVDTTKPQTIVDIEAIGYEGMIRLNWHIDEEDDIDRYEIYRSTSSGVDYSEYYKSVGGDSFSDTSVTKGKTYYYRVAAFDEADNEGDLSIEVYATVLFENTSVSSSGLELKLVGFVDNFISDIDLVINTANSIKGNLELRGDKEREIYTDLKLEREIDNAKSELNSLIREVGNYKSQSLTENELNKKLNSGQLKLNTIKKRIPENIIIISEKTEERSIEEGNIMNLILEIQPDISENLAKKTVEKSLETIDNQEFKTETNAYNLEVVYLDGTRKEISLIKEEIDSQLDENENISIIEVIPKTVVGSVLDIYVKNVNYDVIKEDPIISFSSNTKEIIYSMDNHIDLGLIKEINTILLYEVEESENAPIFTGYFAFMDFQDNKDYIGIIVGVIIVIALIIYLSTIKRRRTSEKLLKIEQKIKEIEKNIKEGKINFAKEIYSSISLDYNNLEKEDKEKIYRKIEKLHKKIISGGKEK